MKITVKQIKQFGRVDTYPVCEVAKKFAKLSGRAVFNEKHIELIKALGFEVEIQPASV